jgi:UDP-N-acetylglucosamine:LPS N-acetylglucosamine transferase
MKKIVFTGGGTVGHVTLNLLLMPRFIKDGWEVHYIGDRNGIEYEQIKNSGYVMEDFAKLGFQKEAVFSSLSFLYCS